MASTKGYRRGYYGEYQYDIPAETRLRVLRSDGEPAAFVTIEMYQRQGPTDWADEMALDEVADVVVYTDHEGIALLPNRPVAGGVTTATGHTLRPNPFGVVDVVGKQNTFLLRILAGDHEEYAWLNLTTLNLAYWQGAHDSLVLPLFTHVPGPGAPVPPRDLRVRVEGQQAHLEWTASPTPGVLGYYVYCAQPPTFTWERVGGLLTGTTHSHSGSLSRLYVVTAVGAGNRESAFSPSAWAPTLRNPTDVVLLPDGERLVLDPQNGYALLHQGADGRWLTNVGSPHFHLEYTRYLARDRDGRLIFSHPGDRYSTRQSVRVTDPHVTPLLEFGQVGSGPAQLKQPAGVAVWGEPCRHDRVWAADEHTRLLLHLDGSPTGADGEQPTSGNVAFAAGRFGQGALLHSHGHRLSYDASNEINLSQGAIELWAQPRWHGDDGMTHVLAEVTVSGIRRMLVQKDGAANLRFQVWDTDGIEKGIAFRVADWRPGDWHHVAVTWSDGRIRLFVDGLLRGERSDVALPTGTPDGLALGSDRWGFGLVDAVIDEVRISDRPRVGDSDTCSYRLLVADAGNHRLQAWDAWGDPVGAFGSLGSGPGQFIWPQGLAVSPSGDVVVADLGNNRLQVLSFDGRQWAHIRSIGPVSQPRGVDVDRQGRIVVAATGESRVRVYGPTGNPVASYEAPNDGSVGSFLWPEGVAVDAEGSIVVADTGRARVVTLRGVLKSHQCWLPLVYR
ncbi:MAG: LamG-like jellyroll fold domain-containing protein [Anaerolineae bacterium]